MTQPLEDSVREFVAEELRIRVADVQLCMTLFGDLGVFGDDAIDLMESFAAKFQVDLEGLALKRHFLGEGDHMWFTGWYFVSFRQA